MKKNFRDIISKYLFYPFVYNFIVKDNVLLYSEKYQIQYASVDYADKIQFKKLKNLLIFSYENSVYYKNLFDSVSFDPYKFSDIKEFSKIPPLTKEIIRNHTLDILTDYKENLLKNTSGGSTGSPITFYANKYMNSHAVSNAWVSDEMAGWSQGARTARLWGHPKDYENSKKFWVRFRYYLMNVNYYDAFDMSEEKMMEYHKNLEEFQPEIILAYASSIFLFAKFLKSKNIKPTYPVKSIITSAEKLHPHMRDVISEVFACNISDRYGSREVGVVGTECVDHKGLHLHPSDHYTEIVDYKDFTKNLINEEGKLLITVLDNFGMPFIRYEIGDVGTVSDLPCSCGRHTRVLSSITGRTSDIIVLDTGRLIHGEYFTHAFYFLEGVDQFQFIQEELNKFVIKIVKNKNWSDSSLDQVYNECYKVLNREKDKISVEFVENISASDSGKFRFTISKVSL